MVSKQLEFRGISLSHLGMYFEELGAEKITNSFPYLFKAINWRAEILSEDVITITSNFKVNQIMILFAAENEQILSQLLKNYRYKTTRVGG